MLYTINVEVMACDTEFSALVVIITMPCTGKCNILSMCTAAFMAVDINPGIFAVMQAAPARDLDSLHRVCNSQNSDSIWYNTEQ